MKLLKSNLILTKSLLIGIILATLTSCDYSDEICHSSFSTPKDGWEKCDTIKISTLTTKETGKYLVKVFVKTNGKYPYQDLWLTLNNDFKRSGHYKNKDVRIQISSRKGDLMGKGINFYQYEVELGEVTLRKGHTYHANIVHNLRQTTIKGITNVGMIIKKS